MLFLIFIDLIPIYENMLSGPNVDKAIFGDLLLSNYSKHHVEITPEQIFVHPNYNSYAYDFDIALIKLSKPVTFTEYVRPACLAESTNETTAYTRCLISGWGNTEIGTYITQLSLTYKLSKNKQTNI